MVSEGDARLYSAVRSGSGNAREAFVGDSLLSTFSKQIFVVSNLSKVY